MQSYEFFDIHTHNPTNRTDVLEVVNLRLPDCNIYNKKWYSAGVHPYDITAESDFLVLGADCFSSPRLVAVGETGLDFRFQSTIARQRDFFLRHIALAQQLRLPLIIHCVRAQPEVLSVLQRTGAERFVFHGFASSALKAKQVFDQGGYVSLGPLMLQNINAKAFVNDIYAINPDRVLLETDDANLQIEQVYHIVADLLQISLEKLKENIRRNFTTLYGERISIFTE